MTTTEAKAVEAALRLVEMAHGDIAHAYEYPQYVQVNALAISRALLSLSARVERLKNLLRHQAPTLRLMSEAMNDYLAPKAQP